MTKTDAAGAAWNTEEFFRTADSADVRAHLDAGADPNARHEDSRTPLQAAARALIAMGADLEALDGHGRTALHWAPLVNEILETLTALLDAGVDPNVRDNDRKLPLDPAKANNDVCGSDAFWRLYNARLRRPNTAGELG